LGIRQGEEESANKPDNDVGNDKEKTHDPLLDEEEAQHRHRQATRRRRRRRRRKLQSKQQPRMLLGTKNDIYADDYSSVMDSIYI